MIKLINDGTGLFSNWFVNRVIIRKVVPDLPNEEYNFPCFCWVSKGNVFFEGKGMFIANKKNIRYSLLGPAWKSAQRCICLNLIYHDPCC